MAGADHPVRAIGPRGSELALRVCSALVLVPLAIGTGTGSEMRRPLGIAIVGGLLVSQMLTLYTTPVIYLYLDGLSLWWARLRGRTPQRGALTHREA